MPKKKDSNSTTITISTIVSSKTRKALLQIEWGSEKAQLSVLEARQHALAILEAAEAAHTDELMLKWLQESVGMDEQNAMGALTSLRDARVAERGEK